MASQTISVTDDDKKRGMQAAITAARKGAAEGGIPIVREACRFLYNGGWKDSRLRLQPADSKRLSNLAWRNGLFGKCGSAASIYLSACCLIFHFEIPYVIVGENETFQGPEEYVRSRGVRLEVVNSPECKEMMDSFIAKNPEVWNEDIGEE